ncbi:uncharacterized protein LOC121871048 isoform X2 [Homarus americanus]|uniref:uncharacterized protein LOC121871048 isoform X2 n=1 Tax=Homarus americanus TaxID=6706 RepID=UPI001C43A3C7|nr:uncharacterized protein LOC121871048 isoform X2 [Homarus americanus]
MRVGVLLVCAAAWVTTLPEAEGTLSFATSLGGLAALKVLKYVGLTKLKENVLGSGQSEGVTDLLDSGYDQEQHHNTALYTGAGAPGPYYNPAHYTGAGAPGPYYNPAHYTGAGAPGPYYNPAHYTGAGAPGGYYIVPASYFDDHRIRVKRDTQEKVLIGSDEEEYFDMIGDLDEDGCVLRTVCELSAAPYNHLTPDEQLIMVAFSTATDAPTSEALRTHKGTYDRAAWLGKTSTGADQSCSTLYSSCPASAQQLMGVFSILEKTQRPRPPHQAAPDASQVSKEVQENVQVR